MRQREREREEVRISRIVMQTSRNDLFDGDASKASAMRSPLPHPQFLSWNPVCELHVSYMQVWCKSVNKNPKIIRTVISTPRSPRKSRSIAIDRKKELADARVGSARGGGGEFKW